jgi:DNA-binding transcriptional LysR family regulator
MAKYHCDLEFRHFRYFVAAAEFGSFRKAAVALNRSQSAVSRQIVDLEDKIGASLFHRHSWGVSLTYAGERFLRRARLIVRNVGDGAADIAAVGRSEVGRVKIGLFSSIASGFLAELLRSYDDRHPKVLVELSDGSPTEHVAAIRALSLDVAFLTGTQGWADCDTEHLWSEGVFAVLPEDHMLAKRDELEWDDLGSETFIVNDAGPGQEIQDYLIQRLAGWGHHPEIRVHNIGRENLLPMVSFGRGLTVVSEAMTAAHFPGICYRRIKGEVLPFSAVWLPRNDNPALRRLLSLARTIARRSRDTKRLPSRMQQSAVPS